MRGHGSLISLVLLFTFTQCAAPAKAPEAAVDPAALRDTIQAREREWSAAFRAGNGRPQVRPEVEMRAPSHEVEPAPQRCRATHAKRTIELGWHGG